MVPEYLAEHAHTETDIFITKDKWTKIKKRLYEIKVPAAEVKASDTVSIDPNGLKIRSAVVLDGCLVLRANERLEGKITYSKIDIDIDPKKSGSTKDIQCYQDLPKSSNGAYNVLLNNQ